MSLLTLDHTVDVVRETHRVDPVRPMNLDEQVHGHGNQFGSTEIRKTVSGKNIEELVNTWTENALRTAESAVATAESENDSPAASIRAAFSLLSAGETERAGMFARQAILLEKRRFKSSETLDVAIIVGCIKVLSTIVDVQTLISIIDDLPSDPYLVGIKASLIASTGDWDASLELVDKVPRDEAAGLLGYLWLQKHDLNRAIRYLRAATILNVKDANAHFNLAIAMFRNGSLKKALRSARVAYELSPGRLDLRNFYLDLLGKAGKWDVLKREVDELRDSKARETPELLIAEARLSLANANRERALALLLRAQRLAHDQGNLKLAAMLKGNQIMLKVSNQEIDRKTAKREMLETLRSHPDNILLAQMLSRLLIKKSELAILREFLGQHAGEMNSAAYYLRAQVAYLEFRFDDYLAEVRSWVKAFPNDSEALSTLITAEGRFDDDWSRAADIAKIGLRKLPRSPFLINRAAYSFIVAGNPQLAEEILKTAPDKHYALEATSGLAKLYLGDIQGGLRSYLQAAKMAEKAVDAENDVILMSLYQGLALRRLNLMNSENERLLRAAALPAVSLPSDWEDYPAFVALKFETERSGWSWPPLVD